MDVFARFWEQAESNPHGCAVIEPGRQYTYEELKEQVQRIAYALSLNGEYPRVLIQLPQSADAYASMLATLMAGGVYSPLNTEAPAQRQSAIAAEFEPNVILTRGKTANPDTFDAGDSTIIDLDKLGEKKLSSPRQPGDLAYVIFTSGSTGKPKGVMIPRQALAHYIDWAIGALRLEPGKRCSQHPNIGFDLSVIDIYATLCSGATLCPLMSMLHRMMPGTAIRDLEIDVWVSVPSVVDLIEKGKQLTAEVTGRLERMFFCGEPLFKRQLDSIFAANPDIEVLNAYGPTEATVSCTVLSLDSKNYTKHCKASVALGNPIEGMELRLDGNTPDQGELLLLGKQLARGYWRDKQKTDKAFVTLADGSRAYRTGDWVVKSNDDLYFSHRIDRQVKVDGYRIELDEIDEALRQSGTTAACTLIHNNALYSFVETAEDLTEEGLTKQLQSILPHYSIPQKITMLKTLPRNTNDKIDALALEEMLKQ